MCRHVRGLLGGRVQWGVAHIASRPRGSLVGCELRSRHRFRGFLGGPAESVGTHTPSRPSRLPGGRWLLGGPAESVGTRIPSRPRGSLGGCELRSCRHFRGFLGGPGESVGTHIPSRSRGSTFSSTSTSSSPPPVSGSLFPIILVSLSALDFFIFDFRSAFSPRVSFLVRCWRIEVRGVVVFVFLRVPGLVYW